ncbi:MAG: hypothetical protein AAF202_10990, partial [Pseudomonadota bacterium]
EERITQILQVARSRMLVPDLESSAQSLPLAGKLIALVEGLPSVEGAEEEVEVEDDEETPNQNRNAKKVGIRQLVASLEPTDQILLGQIIDSATESELRAIALVTNNAVNRIRFEREVSRPSGTGTFFATWLIGGVLLGSNPFLTAVVAAVSAKTLTKTETVEWYDYTGKVDAFSVEFNQILAARQRPAALHIVDNLDKMFADGATPEIIASVLNQFQFTPDDYIEILTRSMRTLRTSEELVILFEAGQFYLNEEIRERKAKVFEDHAIYILNSLAPSLPEFRRAVRSFANSEADLVKHLETLLPYFSKDDIAGVYVDPYAPDENLYRLEVQEQLGGAIWQMADSLGFEQIQQLIDTSGVPYQNYRLRRALIQKARTARQLKQALTELSEIELFALDEDEVTMKLVFADADGPRIERIKKVDSFSVKDRRTMLSDSFSQAFDWGLQLPGRSSELSLAEFLN